MRFSRAAGAGALLIAISALSAFISNFAAAAGAKGKTYDCSSTSPCLSALSSGGAGGLTATSSKGDGVDGIANAVNKVGVFGSSTAATGYGVAGRSYGSAFTGGVYADGGQNGATSMALQTSSTNDVYMIEATNGSGTRTFAIDADGNLTITGLLYTQGYICQYGCAEPNKRRLAYGLTDSRPTVEHSGEAILRNGVAIVRLDRAFANAIDARGYSVLLTPQGDAGALYVAQRTSGGFVVRESGTGHATISFSYRIVARPAGVTAPRLPVVDNFDTRNLVHIARSR